VTELRTIAFRRHQAVRHLRRRLSEDRNQHYDDLTCPCWTSPKHIARLREQPQVCSKPCCGNRRRWEKGANRLSRQERRADGAIAEFLAASGGRAVNR
jgi:hypothetical protein